MSSGWEIKKLSEICTNLDSKRIPITQNKRKKGDIPYYGASGIVDYVEEYLFDEDLLLVSEDGANLLMRTYPIAFSITGKTWVNNHAHVLRFPNTTSQIFVEYYLNSIKLDDYISGMAQPKLNQAMLNSIPIPFPSLSEQKRIVELLDEAFTAIGKAKANIEKNWRNAKELFENYLQNVFANKSEDWEEKTLGEVCEIIGGGTPSKENHKYYNGNILWATVRDMRYDLIEETEHKITKDAVKQSSTNIIPKGNVVIATRVGLGKACIIKYDTAINQDLKGVIPKNTEQLSVYFLFRWFKSIAESIVTEGTGATVQGVKLTFINSLKISFPSVKKQRIIIKKINSIEEETKKLEDIYQQKLNDLEELKKSILQKAFNGELTATQTIPA